MNVFLTGTQHYLLFAVPEATGNAFGSPGQSVYEEQHTCWKSWRAAKSKSIKQGLGAHWQDLGLQQALWDPAWSKLSSEHGEGAASAWFFHQEPAWRIRTGLGPCRGHHNCHSFTHTKDLQNFLRAGKAEFLRIFKNLLISDVLQAD